MKHFEDVKTINDARMLSAEELFEIDREMTKYHLEFDDPDISTAFAENWVMHF